MSQDPTKPKRILLPLLGEFRPLGDGTYHYRPIPPGPDGDTWLSCKDAAKILHWPIQSVYDYLGDLLIAARPLKRKRLVSLRSVVKLQEALRELDFWDSQAKQNKLRDWVFEQMAEPRNV